MNFVEEIQSFIFMCLSSGFDHLFQLIDLDEAEPRPAGPPRLHF